MNPITFNIGPNGENFYRQTTLVHLNGNVLCSVSVKATGPVTSEHEIYEIGIIPVDSFYNRRHDKLPLDLLIRPNYPDKINWENYKQTRKKKLIEKAVAEGHPQHVAMRLFERWFKDLCLPVRKCIAPIGHNYSFASRHLCQWLGDLNYKIYFESKQTRDVQTIAHFLNDLADIRGAPYPFRKTVLTYLARHLNVPQNYGTTKSALHEAAMIADIYRELLRMIQKEVII